MRMSYVEGVIVAILVPFVFLFLGFVSFYHALFLSIFLLGVWTIIAAFALVGKEELKVYTTWGIVIACLSTFLVISATYAIALVLIAIIASVFVFAAGRKS